MWKPTRVQTSLIAILGVVLIASADPPTPSDFDELRPLRVPSLDETPAPDPDSESKIRDALRGVQVDAPNPMLDGVLDAIRDQGSVLDGSALADPSLDRPLPAKETRRRIGDPPTAKRARLAEQMLRVARLLQQELPGDPAARMGSDSEELHFLVDRLRHHAGRILIESGRARSTPARRR